MDTNVQRYIAGTKDWDELDQIELNIKQRGGMSDEVAAAIRARADALGLAYVMEKTGFDPSSPTPAELQAARVIGQYAGIMKRQGKAPNYTLRQIRRLGLIDAMEAAVSHSNPTQGFEVLAAAELKELSYEQIVLDNPSEFSPRAIWYSRRTLKLPNSEPRPPAATHRDVHERTNQVVAWFAQRIRDFNGILQHLTIEGAASDVGIAENPAADRILSNIFSRIDFASYQCGLPPLGTTVRLPSGAIWTQGNRNWAFPAQQLQAAAKAHTWTDQDVERIGQAVAGTYGIAHLCWRAALEQEESHIRMWVRQCIASLKLSLPADERQPARLPVAELNRATPEFIWSAVQRLIAGEVSHSFGPSTDFDLIADDGQRLPPKAVFGVALSAALNDQAIGPYHFSGGEDSPCFRLLRAAGYHVIPKAETISNDSRAEAAAEWVEGGAQLRTHMVRERAAGLAQAKKAQYRRIHGRLACESCKLDPVQHYGTQDAEACIEVHHAGTAVGHMAAGHRTSLDDLQCLCANCHRLVHRTIAQAK